MGSVNDDINSTMDIQTHLIGQTTIAEVISDEILITSDQDVLELLGILNYLEIDKVIIQEQILTPDFFDLENGIAGEILQKFSNYRVRLAIVGNFRRHTGKSIKAFIFESNKGKQVNFVNSLQEGLTKLAE